MICLIALIVFGIMGIISASHRQLAKEAFDCVFKRMIFKPCTTGFDKKMKAKITGKISKRSERGGKFIYKHFEIISWIFTIITIVSLVLSAVYTYNWVVYGNCDGPNSTGFCIFNTLTGKTVGTDTSCDYNCSSSECAADAVCNQTCSCDDLSKCEVQST